MDTLKEKFSLKDHLFNSLKIERIATEIKRSYPSFEKDQFYSEVIGKLPQLELKERIYHITNCLKKHLPQDFKKAVQVLLKALPEPCNPNLSDDDFGDFIYAPYNHYIAIYGCNEENLDLSLQALEELTTRFSAEDAIRYFINAFPTETMKKMHEWSIHNHYHVRRLASEGSRAKLPWCQKITIAPESTLTILDKLYTDTTRFVTRSVANHMNDLSKINPMLTINQLAKWKKSGKQTEKEMDFIIKHALRTLIKNGNKDALELIGIKENPAIEILSFDITENVKMNTKLVFSLEIMSLDASHLLIDYIIHFQNKNGEMKSKKVFKLKQVKLKKNEIISIHKKHLMRESMTTRTIYPGRHLCQIQINGKVVTEQSFNIISIR